MCLSPFPPTHPATHTQTHTHSPHTPTPTTHTRSSCQPELREGCGVAGGWVTFGRVNGGENGCRKMHNFALSLTVMGSLKSFPPAPFPLFFLRGREPLRRLLLLLETHGACSPVASRSRPQAPRRRRRCLGKQTALDSSYILHHSQPRAERRVSGPGGLGAEFSRDPGPGEREEVMGGGLEPGDPMCVSLVGVSPLLWSLRVLFEGLPAWDHSGLSLSVPAHLTLF